MFKNAKQHTKGPRPKGVGIKKEGGGEVALGGRRGIPTFSFGATTISKSHRTYTRMSLHPRWPDTKKPENHMVFGARDSVLARPANRMEHQPAPFIRKSLRTISTRNGGKREGV